MRAVRETAKFTELVIPVFQLFCVLGIIISVFQDIDQGRLSTAGYLIFGLIQCFSIGVQFFRRNFLTAIFGLCLTGLLLFGVALEYTPEPHFDFVFAANAYTPPVIEKAYHALLFCSSLYHLLTMQFVPRMAWQWPEPDFIEEEFARRAVWVFLALGLLLTFLTVRGSTITTAAYASLDYNQNSGPIGSAGLELISTFLLVFVIVAAVRAWGYQSWQFRVVCLVIVGIVFYFRMLRGDRSASLGIFTTLGLLYFTNSTHKKRFKIGLLISSALGLYIIYEVWGYVRFNAAEQGLIAASLAGFVSVFESFFGSSQNGFDPLRITLLPQSYWHLLHTVDLYESHIRLDGTSFIDLIPQSIPGFISDMIGFERPLNGAWRLAEYRLHGGGMFVVAEGYWNYGLLGTGIIATGLAVVAIQLEKWHRKQEPLLYCTYFAFLGTFGFGIFYGLQSLVKAFEIALVIALAMSFIIRWHRNKQLRLLAIAERNEMLMASYHGELVDEPGN